MTPSDTRMLWVLGLLSFGAFYAWSKTIWDGWAEVVYRKTPTSSPVWFWLRLFRIPVTESHAVRWLKGASLAGMLLLGAFWLGIGWFLARH